MGKDDDGTISNVHLDPRFRGGERSKKDPPHIPLIPAKAGIQSNNLRIVSWLLDPRFRGGKRWLSAVSR